MFEEHYAFKSPENQEQFIWRYLDFTKFLDLIITEELYFTRMDKFDDKFEGSNTIPTVKAREIFFQYLDRAGEMIPENVIKAKNALDKEYEELRQYFTVNCWHMNDYESDAMWSRYAKESTGIAIRSTYKRLVTAIQASPLIIHIGKVGYVDFRKDLTPWGNAFILVLLKDKSFEHEKELRVVIWSKENKKYCDPIEHGVRVKISIDELVESIFLSPSTPLWIRSLVEQIMKKYGVNKPVWQSCLEGKPVY